MGIQEQGHFINKGGNVTLDSIVYTNNRGKNSRKRRKQHLSQLSQTLDQWNNGTTVSRQKGEQKKKLKRECILKNHKHNKDSK
jgi:hypothetical protein